MSSRLEVYLLLGRRLYETMNRLDPQLEETPTWDGLSARQREFYALCVDGVFEDTAAATTALELADDYEVGRRSEATE